MIGDIPALRSGEVTTDLPTGADAGLFFIGRLRTPWQERVQCPRRGDPAQGPPCRVVVDPRWHAALADIERFAQVELLYWMHLARRDLVLQNPQRGGTLFGTFALRSPMRPNPISSSVVALLERDGGELVVRGLDCVDGTPLIDIKPVRCPQWAIGSPDNG